MKLSSTTAAFFGTNSVVRGLARIAGLPRPLAVLCSSVTASIVSEGKNASKLLILMLAMKYLHILHFRRLSVTKKAGRSSSCKRDSLLSGSDANYSDMKFQDELKGSEIAGDITKWIVYDGLEDLIHDKSDDHFATVVLATFFIGCFSALVSTAVKDFGISLEDSKRKVNVGSAAVVDFSSSIVPTIKSNDSEVLGNRKATALRYGVSALEGGVLFASYQVVIKIIKQIVPANLNQPFIFNTFIQNVEQILDPDIS